MSVKVLIEYCPEQERVIVRGVFREKKDLPPLAPNNQQNWVSVFEDVDMKWHLGFTGLVPSV